MQCDYVSAASDLTAAPSHTHGWSEFPSADSNANSIMKNNLTCSEHISLPGSNSAFCLLRVTLDYQLINPVRHSSFPTFLLQSAASCFIPQMHCSANSSVYE